jgi:para-nitrobenzyl esterase
MAARTSVTILMLLSFFSTIECRKIVVKTKLGTILGSFMNVGNGVHRFAGIPYASPPVDELRFKKPVPPKKLVTPLEAFNFSRGCVSPFGEIERTGEDCLYLNVWKPADAENSLVFVIC